MNDVASSAVLVLGGGASGIAAARLLRRENRAVVVADERGAASEDIAGVSWVSDLPDLRKTSFAFAVISPGFAREHPWLAALREFGVCLIPEFEYGVTAMPKALVIAVTGSNGKSSLVKWIADTLTAEGKRAVAAGNYGLPPCALAAAGDVPEVLVLELSSFQLEQAVRFQPDIAIVLNLAPNHLDRHGAMSRYIAAKARLLDHPPRLMPPLVHAPAWPLLEAVVPPGLKPVLFDAPASAAVGEGGVDLSDTWWGRSPLRANAQAALAVFAFLGIPASAVRRSAERFAPLPHRLELVAEFQGVRYINDSKASTLTALAAAVAAGPEKKHLIAGGILKETDVNFVKEILAKHCAFVYAIGQAAEKLTREWGDTVACEPCRDLATAVRMASDRARSGDVVLLSPGCSSFDQFRGYGHRGDVFKELVQACIREQKDKETNHMQGVR
ncbi:MAG TPA: Mur ligase family protein [Kiritimatiellia bacterium]|nr:Mur ligase family protein [Kiritimatiellia bacterium]HMO99009.1 Mur ligase family protein [Kiritimatiellia bacterium]HMP95896.1 Mur ligase family protein [Kiritimatiellia bacterium]